MNQLGRRSAARVALAAGLVVVCLLGSGQVAAAGPPSGPPTVDWAACAEEVLAEIPPADHARYSCATYQVPMDHDRPAAGTIGLAMLRRAAEDPARRIGSLFLNPGGPGGSGYLMPVVIAAELPAEVRQRFDLIGFDPRGVARSTPLRCFTTREEAEEVFGRMVDVPITRTEIDSTLAADRDYTDACATNAGPLVGHMSTRAVAQDLDLMRQAVRDRRLNYLGFSYGSLLGATYLNLYPHRTRAIVLDGNVDPRLRTTDGLQYLRQRAAGQEAVVDAFLQRCTEAGPACAFSDGDPRAKFAEIRERLRQGPLTVPELGGPVTLSDFVNGVSGYLYNAQEYAELAVALQLLYAAAHPGAPAPAAATRSVIDFAGAAAHGGLIDQRADAPYDRDDAGLGVNCSDEPFPRSQAPFVRAAGRWEAESPTVGRAHAFSQVACATWPATAAQRYRGPWDRRTAEPVLLFGNYHDPATNYRFNLRMAAELGNARLVTADAFGHTILGLSACADAIAARYLVDLAVPARGTVCQPDHQPFE